MKRYLFLRIMSVLLMGGGLIFGLLVMAMVLVAEDSEMSGVLIMGIALIVGGVGGGAYLDMQVDNARNNAATVMLLSPLMAKRGGKG